MLLALTSLGAWWEKDEEILLLGPWCAPYDKREKLESLRWRMLPSPWEDRDRLSAASEYVGEVYRRLLPKLSAQLDQVLGVQEPLAHWRVLIGPWLLHFVHSLYDRYVHLLDALSFVPHLRASVLAESCFRTPRTTREALTWLPHDDHYNWQLFSELLALMPQSSGVPVTHDPNIRIPLTSRRGPSRLRRWTGRAHAGVLGTLGRRRRAWLTGITASRSSLLGLAVRSRLQIIPASMVDIVGADAREATESDRRRQRLGELTADDDFEAICIRLLARHLPAVYLESYHDARRTVRRWYPRTPSLLVTETEWFMNETYKYVIADAMARGSRLVTVQHGGYYGYTRPMPFEDLEREIGQVFLVWGWADRQPSLGNLPHPIVSQRPKPLRPGGRILFAVHEAERYLYRLGATGAGSLWEPQWQWQVRFMNGLPAALRQRVAVRPPPQDIGQCVNQRLRDQFPEISVDRSSGFKQSATRSRLIVLERPGTCLLESLAMNHPTVVFWEPTLWNLRDAATPYFEALRNAGILWESPEAAAAHVAAVYHDPSTWWDTESVQAARGAFVERFALARRDWPSRWIEAICEQLSA